MACPAWQDACDARSAAWGGAPEKEANMLAPDDFEVMVVGGDGEAIAYVVGEVDLNTRDRLMEALILASADSNRLVIDLSRTTFIDSTGLKALVEVWRSCVDVGVEVVLREPSAAVMRTLQIVGLADLLPIDLPTRPSL
jgi:anti-anti-sigma factor